MKIMLHSCCGPCTTYSLEHLRQQGHEVKGIFFNPNIHPYTEFRRRLEAFAGFCAQAGHEAQIVDDTGCASSCCRRRRHRRTVRRLL